MMKITKKRVVLFLLFIFPLICFLILSTGKNNFTKLPILSNNVLDISVLDSTKTLKDNISIVCFLGNDIKENKGGFFNLNEKIYKKFIEYNKFQIIAIYPKEKELQAREIKEEIGLIVDENGNLLAVLKKKLSLYIQVSIQPKRFLTCIALEPF